VIHHGGAGTVAAACRAGVPSVVLPFFFDQSFWGNWLRRRSLGPTPLSHRGLSASALVAALAEALDSPSVHANLASLSEALRAEDGAERAASVIEATLGR
jgi:sterol 3beta-glucosyltransferase